MLRGANQLKKAAEDQQKANALQAESNRKEAMATAAAITGHTGAAIALQHQSNVAQHQANVAQHNANVHTARAINNFRK